MVEEQDFCYVLAVNIHCADTPSGLLIWPFIQLLPDAASIYLCHVNYNITGLVWELLSVGEQQEYYNRNIGLQ